MSDNTQIFLHHFFIFLLIIEILQGTFAEDFTCANITSSCYCTQETDVDLKFSLHCAPNDGYNLSDDMIPDIQIEYTIGESITIECDNFNSTHKNPLDYLLAINLRPTKEVLIKNCKFADSENINIAMLLEAFAAQQISLQYSTFPGNHIQLGRINEHLKRVLQRIEVLHLDNNNLVDIPYDLLAQMPNLWYLTLKYNQLRNVTGPFNPKLISLELASNEISQIAEDAFDGLTSLRELHLWHNQIERLPTHVFRDLRKLESLELMRNRLQNVPAQLFHTLPLLEMLNLESNQFSSLPVGLLASNKKLKSIRMGRNRKLRTLPDDAFSQLSNVTKITMQDCSIAELSPPIFDSLLNLQSLNLANNRLATIPQMLFYNLDKLEELHLEKNAIKSIELYAFQKLKVLKVLDLSHNKLAKLNQTIFPSPGKITYLNLANNSIKLDQTDLVSPMNVLLDLEQLILSDNQVTFIPDDFVNTKTNMKLLDLSNNNIEELDIMQLYSFANDIDIDVSSNDIKVINNMRVLEVVLCNSNEKPLTNIKLNIAHNPLTCDFNNYDLFRYFHDQIDPYFHSLFDIKSDDVLCASPLDFEDVPLLQIRPESILEPLVNCSHECDCYKRYYNSTYIIDCSNRNLTRVPDLFVRDPSSDANAPACGEHANIHPAHFVEVNLRHNRIEKLRSTSFISLHKVKITYLDVSYNNLSQVNWLPQGVKAVMLDHNYLTRINDTMLERLHNFTLDNNPWVCDCDTIPFWIFLGDNVIHNKMNIRCENNNKPIRLLSREILCPSNAKLVTTFVGVGALLIIIPSIGLVIFYKYKQEIKVWLYAHSMCLWFVREEDLDKDKIYDAFISFSQHDESFIIEELMPKLENSPNPYKLCIHMRNWIPGEFIAKQVADSVLSSRRTIVVLSPSFLESVWGKLEFRAAHTKALTEGVARVIVILYNDLDPNDERIDEELRMYLKTNTYIKWGDPWFWDKLRYALPHRKSGQGGQANKRFESISAHLDNMDKLNQNVSKNAHANTNFKAPPIDPLLLKDSLSLKIDCSSEETPPAEKGV